MEATHPGAADIAALKEIVPAGTSIYLSAVPTQPHRQIVDAAVAVRRAGLAPVPHLAVRHYGDAGALRDFLARAAGAADVRTVLVIAGDRDRPLGPFASALDLIESGLLQQNGIAEIGIAGYPDGHPRIAAGVLDRALSVKVAAAARTGLRVHVVSQFCFDASRIVRWLADLRTAHPGLPVKAGMAGPTSIGTLLRYAQRCGGRASFGALTRHAKAMGHLLAPAAPDAIIGPLATACAGGVLGPVTPHFFSFGGVERTAQWAAAAGSRHDLVL
jgi:methylenetetrahydrofolate reductase (NADPH)